MATKNFVVEAYRSFTFTVNITDSAGAVVNLTGETITMDIKTDYDAVATLSLASGSGLTITAGTGTIVVFLTAAQCTTLLANNQYIYDIKSAEGTTIQTYLNGTIQAVPVVTQ